MRCFLLLCAVLVSLFSSAQQITPMPVEVKMKDDAFTIDANTRISSTGQKADYAANYFIQYLEKYYRYHLPSLKPGEKKKSIKIINLTTDKNLSNKEGYYELKVDDDKIEISGNSDTAVFYGIQSLIQLLPVDAGAPLTIPGVKIKDYPRFGYRGMHLDVARHFFPVSYIKKYIDYLALHKMNNFHWHLTDDQGWRIEIKKYPLLTELGGCRDQTLAGRYGSDKYDSTRYCGYYTRDDIKEIVAYAAARYINIIPEIEMPGHAMAAIKAYPQLSCNPERPKKVAETWGVFEDIICPSEFSFHFLENVLTEVMELFPSKYIHIGGDEAPKSAWKNSSLAQQVIKDNQLKDEQELQSYFIRRIEKFVNSKGRSIIGWDEILEGGLAPNATVMSWRGEKGGIAAAKEGHYVIMTPQVPLYFDHSQTRNEDSLTRGNYNNLETVYAYSPLPPSLTVSEQKFILGAQGNVWTEYMDNGRKVDYMIFPRMGALAEVLWTPANKKSWDRFESRLPVLMKRYDLWQTSYSTAYYDLQPSVIALPSGGIGWELKTRYPGAAIKFVRDKSSDVIYPYEGPVEINTTGWFGATIADDNGNGTGKWSWQYFSVNKATGKKIKLTKAPNASYAGNGALSLVDAIQNTEGMVKSQQFLGFLGTDLEAVIDLGKVQPLRTISLHAFEQQGSWIYRPATVVFYTSNDGSNWKKIPGVVTKSGEKNLLYSITTSLESRYVKVLAESYGQIPEGQPGAGTRAWLFADEIVVE